MKLVVNGFVIPIRPVPDGEPTLQIGVTVESPGETLPETWVTVDGGKLDVYLSKVHRSGDIVLHPFGEEPT